MKSTICPRARFSRYAQNAVWPMNAASVRRFIRTGTASAPSFVTAEACVRPLLSNAAVKGGASREASPNDHRLDSSDQTERRQAEIRYPFFSAEMHRLRHLDENKA